MKTTVIPVAFASAIALASTACGGKDDARACPNGKCARDAFGVFANERVSDNFVMKWGPRGAWSEAEADRMLVAFEQAWQSLVVELGLPAPTGSDEFLFNIYISKTGGDVPLLHGDEVPTYVATDPEGFEFVVMDPELYDFDTAYDADRTDFASAHEFTHALQLASGAYDQTTNLPAYWYWEATADWAAEEAQPGSQEVGVYTGAYLMYPHVSIEFFVPDPLDFGETVMLNVHQYGANLLLRYMTEYIADASIVRDTWTQAGPLDDPIANLNRSLAPAGVDVAGVFADFAARATAYDFERGAQYRGWHEVYQEQFPAEDLSVAAVVESSGAPAFRTPPVETLPQAYAYNVLRLTAPVAGRLTVAVEGVPVGSAGTAAAFRSVLIREFADRVEYVDLEGDELSSQAVVDGVGGEQSLTLIVASVPDVRVPDEVFDYTYRMAIEP